MLELRPCCELCGDELGPHSDNARICTYECTFCASCATWKLYGICPNCGGEFVTRPRRPSSALAKHPASTTAVRREHDVAAHQAKVIARLLTGDLPLQLWTNTFANQRVAAEADDGYAATANEMQRLAAEQPGFSGIESVRAADGRGITVSWWSSLAAMLQWRSVSAHVAAQQTGRERWYEWYRSDVSRVDRTSNFGDRPEEVRERSG